MAAPMRQDVATWTSCEDAENSKTKRFLNKDVICESDYLFGCQRLYVCVLMCASYIFAYILEETRKNVELCSPSLLLWLSVSVPCLQLHFLVCLAVDVCEYFGQFACCMWLTFFLFALQKRRETSTEFCLNPCNEGETLLPALNHSRPLCTALQAPASAVSLLRQGVHDLDWPSQPLMTSTSQPGFTLTS